MTLEAIRDVFAWCSVINLGLLLWWGLVIRLAHDWAHRMHSKWLEVSVETFDAIHYGAMGVYKLGIVLFNLVPYFALRIVG